MNRDEAMKIVLDLAKANVSKTDKAKGDKQREAITLVEQGGEDDVADLEQETPRE